MGWKISKQKICENRKSAVEKVGEKTIKLEDFKTEKNCNRKKLL